MKQESQVCARISSQVEHEWIELNRLIEFYLKDGRLVCEVCRKRAMQFVFFELAELQLVEVAQPGSPSKHKKDGEQRELRFRKK